MKKNISKNYIKLALILILIIFLTLLACNLYRNYDKNKINSSYIADYVSTIQYNELKNAMLEFSSNTFVYISYTGDKDIYYMEKDLKKVVVKNNLEDNFIYVDATSILDEDNYLDSLNTLLGLTDEKITELPAIVYFKDTLPVDFVDSSTGMISAASFSQLLDEYEIVTTSDSNA